MNRREFLQMLGISAAAMVIPLGAEAAQLKHYFEVIQNGDGVCAVTLYRFQDDKVFVDNHKFETPNRGEPDTMTYREWVA